MSALVKAPGQECVGSLQEIAQLYAAQAVRIRRLVHLRLTAPDAVVEDACQVAWLRLVRNRTRVHRRTADSWLVQVATREAMRLIDRGGRERPLEELEDVRVTAPDLLEGFAEHESRLGVLERLPERQRRLLWMQGLGFSYAEMAGATGESRRTVERQLARARDALAGA